jgi:phosphate starvation-inducible PhoH-like protein
LEDFADLRTKKRVLTFQGIDPLKLFGSGDRHLDIIDSRYPGVVVVRGEDIILSGSNEQIDRLTRFFGEIIDIARTGRAVGENDFRYILGKGNGEDAASEFGDLNKDVVVSTRRGGDIKPRSPGQKGYIDAIRAFDVVFGVGPAGTGKTYLAVACAVSALKARRIDRIFLVRPVVEAGESLGFLPGDFQAKLDPYVRPVVDALGDMLGADRTVKLMENGTIEIAPLAYMRGRTLNNAYVILDEAQNTTEMQMKMFLTRMGQNAKAIVNGDITQIDLEPPSRSGLIAARRILGNVDGIAFVDLTRSDIVRHRLVQKIVMAFDNPPSQTGDGENE